MPDLDEDDRQFIQDHFQEAEGFARDCSHLADSAPASDLNDWAHQLESHGYWIRMRLQAIGFES